MQLASPKFGHNGRIPSLYTCNGKNINPPLTLSEVPANAVTLVLIVDDPDAPMGVWTHWLVWNIDPKTTSIEENSIPGGSVQGTSSYAATLYQGPCPPSGTHHYRFKLYALDARLDLHPSATQTDVETAMKNHILSESTLVGLYQSK